MAASDGDDRAGDDESVGRDDPAGRGDPATCENPATCEDQPGNSGRASHVDRAARDGRLPAYPDVGSHGELVAWSRAYAEYVVRTRDLAVDLERVDWRVSTRAKRRAAGVRWPRVEGASVGDPLDWAGVPAADGDGPPTCTVALTWAAYEAYDREEWTATLRHELVHVEQYQRFGATDHGDAFRERAAGLSAPVRCRRFAPPAYRLLCVDCGEEVGVRYRASKVVRRPGSYQSRCCGAALQVEEGEG